MPTASAPASAANLGPGFDVLALALELRCTVTAVPSDRWEVVHTGPEQPLGGDDLVLEAAQRARGEEGPLSLTVNNDIPIGRGLGSSAATAAAAAGAAWRTRGWEPHPRTIFELVAAMEDHPDNAAAAVFGGLVLCSPDGQVHNLTIHPSLIPVIAIPERQLATSEARSLLPETFPRQAVVRSLGRMGALVAGLTSGEPALLAATMGDELHEGPRNQLRPEVAKLIDVARGAGALHACWSGAGPSVLALVLEDSAPTLVEALSLEVYPGIVRRFQVATTGLI